MYILLSFLPYLVNALASFVVAPQWALLASGIIALLLVLHGRFVEHRSVKIIEAGSALLFLGLAAAVAFIARPWQQAELRLLVDIGLVVIVLVSLMLRRPFTIQYALEEVTPEVAAIPAFYTVNQRITCAWLLAFLVMALANWWMMHGLEDWIGIGMIVAAMVAAVRFTKWYPAHRRAKMQAAAATS